MYTPVSVYILTHNSERYLDEILTKVARLADDILLVDSGSTDRTELIAKKHHARIVHRPFDNFRYQRHFALEHCQHSMVLTLDSDEVPDDTLIDAINRMKVSGFDLDAYRIERHWIVMGKRIRVLYSILAPDHPIRLLNKEKVNYTERSVAVHESPFGYSLAGYLAGRVNHYTFETQTEIDRKLQHYTSMIAPDTVTKYGKITWVHRFIHPPVIWAKWYLLNGGWRDGQVGWALGRYAFLYALIKFQKAAQLNK